MELVLVVGGCTGGPGRLVSEWMSTWVVGVNGASEASSEESAAVYDSDDGQEEDVDDDSPYFVKITLDGQFLMHLKEPNLVNG